MILAISTALDTVSTALQREEGTIICLTGHEPNRHDELLVPLVEQALALTGSARSDLSAVAVVAGPGSFTGLRIGISAAKGIALALGCPMILVNTFEAMAGRVAAVMEPRHPVPLFPVLDARRGDVYAGRFELAGRGWTQFGPPAVHDAAAFLAALPHDAWLAGDTSALPALPPGSAIRRLPAAASAFDAADVGRIAWGRLRDGDLADAATCEPLYVRDFHVTRH